MKILFVLENYFPNIGGVETLFKALVERLTSAGHECIIVTSLLNEDDPRMEALSTCRIIRIPVGSRYLFTLKALLPVMRHIRSCDLVQTTSYNAALPAFIAALFYRKRIVVTFHEAWGKLWFKLPYMGRLSQLAHYAFEQLLLRLPFDRFVAVSQATAKRLAEEGVARQRIVTVYNGIDYSEFERVAPATRSGRFTFTYFGRLGISKGLDLLLPAAVITRERLADSCLELIIPTAPADFLEQIKQEITDRRLDDYIRIRHHLPFAALKATIAASDCVVIPSYSEGFCFAAVETMAIGTPIVSSGRGALSEVIGGRFVEMETQTAEALAAAMQRAYRQEWEVRPKKQFELEDTCAGYLQLYQQILSTPAPRTP